ncbi:sterol carrier protein domain-containing protein [Rhodococcus sp. BP-349]|uniref:sterol carrier protein domain-containing protein n=1 Tax=unclassified Rhodococcus (in: high G+C Gram-positive bacteria) TaxID=192944 RepID=UPI001C9B37D0|nr:MULTISPECIES: sterol carrier protein domain-containing protein [unclassified Rhodococcus (in: high G+C Gram-positive bacteria)]MBY6539323.1 sterol carrier protein domain-containing protein [Rhodococcus sp. BP-363]MBY6544349.1 sterol carrier protein domain-containing protein [Rhodococcus sp. BP-369]MBY6563579.1 sterol carrier protein domain-containing protein [Rhodococcus sp. BP-370]MBY6577871.1 sterol carrier protein domain-containing protein [Rhodococcus sp. BP-364]MBY6587172.1 sterol carr
MEGRSDFLWLRVLDVSAVLEARTYFVDGTVTLAVTDDMGFATGTYRLTVVHGEGTVHRTSNVAEELDSDVLLDVAALGSVLLGGVSVSTVAAAGHIRGPGTADLAALMVCRTAPALITPF